jgi:hypothetical protein
MQILLWRRLQVFHLASVQEEQKGGWESKVSEALRTSRGILLNEEELNNLIFIFLPSTAWM